MILVAAVRCAPSLARNPPSPAALPERTVFPSGSTHSCRCVVSRAPIWVASASARANIASVGVGSVPVTAPLNAVRTLCLHTGSAKCDLALRPTVDDAADTTTGAFRAATLSRRRGAGFGGLLASTGVPATSMNIDAPLCAPSSLLANLVFV